MQHLQATRSTWALYSHIEGLVVSYFRDRLREARRQLLLLFCMWIGWPVRNYSSLSRHVQDNYVHGDVSSLDSIDDPNWIALTNAIRCDLNKIPNLQSSRRVQGK